MIINGSLIYWASSAAYLLGGMGVMAVIERIWPRQVAYIPGGHARQDSRPAQERSKSPVPVPGAPLGAPLTQLYENAPARHHEPRQQPKQWREDTMDALGEGYEAGVAAARREHAKPAEQQWYQPLRPDHNGPYEMPTGGGL